MKTEITKYVTYPAAYLDTEKNRVFRHGFEMSNGETWFETSREETLPDGIIDKFLLRYGSKHGITIHDFYRTMWRFQEVAFKQKLKARLFDYLKELLS